MVEIRIIVDKNPISCYFLFLSFLLINVSLCQSSFSLIIAKNPFGTGEAKIESINRITNDGRLIVNLEYSPRIGELTFF